MDDFVGVQRILIVDDEPLLLSSLIGFIEGERSHYLIESAGSAEEALEKVENSVFDLMITDYKLPKMDGLSLASEVHERSPNTWTIIMTAFGTNDADLNAYSRGCVGYLEKPFDPDMLLGWIDKALSRSREIEGLDRPVNSAGTPHPTGIFCLPGIQFLQDFDTMFAIEETQASDYKPWFTPKTTTYQTDGLSFFLSVCSKIRESTASFFRR